MPWMDEIIVKTANYCGIQCTYGKTFNSIDELKKFIDAGYWDAGTK